MPSLTYFGFFPWAAFLAFGMSAGSILRLVSHEDLGKVMLWALGLGVVLMISAQYLSSLPYSVYAKSDFWLNSPALTLIKLGLVMCIMSVAYLWVNMAGDPARFSLMRQLGMTSLLIYWVHIELVYGRWFGFWKESLSTGQVVIFTLCLIALMTLLSRMQTNFSDFKRFFRPEPVPRQVAGD
jgi:uncharacterized membrane protein